MRVESHFFVPLSQEETWGALLDFRRVASAMPGAHVDEVNGSEVKGAVTIKLGPMKVEYRGTARVEADDPNRGELHIVAEGHEVRGSGSASVSIQTTLKPGQAGTDVDIVADLDITGRPAQMGAGVIQEVAQRLTDEFAENLRNGLIEVAPPAHSSSGEEAGVSDLDLLKLAGGPVARRAAIVAAVGLALWLLWKLPR